MRGIIIGTWLDDGSHFILHFPWKKDYQKAARRAVQRFLIIDGEHPLREMVNDGYKQVVTIDILCKLPKGADAEDCIYYNYEDES